MALPELLAPPGTCFLLNAHANTPGDLDDDVQFMQGHSRKRRVQTSAPRVVDVSAIFKTADTAAIFDDWFENTLSVGNGLFTAKVAPVGADSRYWAAQWVGPLAWSPMGKGRWQISGQLLLTGQGSDTPPLGATLATEYRAALTGSAKLTVGVSLATEFSASLVAHLPLRTEYVASLEADIPSYFERESDSDGAFIQREDGTNLQRE